MAFPGVTLGAGKLEIHHINVQQGDATFIIGPDGTTLLIDAGKPGKGNSEVVPYLASLGYLPGVDSIDYLVASHLDSDHVGGLDEVIYAGYDITQGLWDNGSSKTGTQITQFIDAAATTTAGLDNLNQYGESVAPMTVGLVIDLGGGATAICVVVGGDLIDGNVVSIGSDENDSSIGLLIQHRKFDYFTAGDLGGGDDDEACTGRSTSQNNVETPLAGVIKADGSYPLLGEGGLEVLRVSHHGSESSTNVDLFDILSPSLAVISVGEGQGGTWDHPRRDVVENVLLAEASCVTGRPALVLQTDEDSTPGPSTSLEGYAVGDIIISTRGRTEYSVRATGEMTQGMDERNAAGLCPSGKSFALDEWNPGPVLMKSIRMSLINPDCP